MRLSEQLRCSIPVWIAFATIVLSAASIAQADPATLAGERLHRALLRQKNATRVLVAVREDARAASGDAEAVNEKIYRQLDLNCRYAGLSALETSRPNVSLAAMTVGRLPRPDRLAALLGEEESDLMITAVWQRKRAAQLDVRLSLVNYRKVLWTWRGVVDFHVKPTGNSREADAVAAVPQSSGIPALDRQSTNTPMGNSGSALFVPSSAPERSGQNTQSPPAVANSDLPALNRKVLEFAYNHLGQQVAGGQCWALGAEALDYAGAAPPRGVVFGKEVPLKDALPGDILEFSNAVVVNPDGSRWTFGTPFHTAIVNSREGTRMTILQQNVNGLLKVEQTTIDLANLKSGSVTAYRPQPKAR